MFERITITFVTFWMLAMLFAFVSTSVWLERKITESVVTDAGRLKVVDDGSKVEYRPPAEGAGDELQARTLPLVPEATREDPVLQSDLWFHGNPPLLVWLVFVALTVALSVGLALLLGWVLFRLRSEIPRGEKPRLRDQYGLIVAGVISVLAVGIPIFYSAEFGGLVPIVKWYELLGAGLEDPLSTVFWMQLIPGLAGALVLFGMLLSGHTVDDLEYQVQSENDPVAALHTTLHRYRAVKFALRLCLASGSALLVMVILTTGALREALLTVVSYQHPWIAPTEFLYLYGLLFTVVLALVYLPIYSHVRLVGVRIFDKVVQPLQGDMGQDIGRADSDDVVYSARKVLTGQESIANKVVSWISIAAPVLGTVLPDLISF